MASIISAGTTSGTALNMAGDTSGILQLATNGSTTAITIDTSQRAAFVAGTAALPAITTTGDTNTGMFFPAADTIAFAEGGAEVMRIDSSGNVGIGITPSAWITQIKAMQTLGSGTWSNGLSSAFYSNVYRGSGYTAYYIATGVAGEVAFNSNGAGEWTFSTAPSGTAGTTATLTERMCITSVGNVGIGLTDPASPLNLLTGQNFGGGFNMRNTNGSRWEFVTGGDNKLYMGYAASGTPAAVGNFATNGIYTATSDIRKKKDISYTFNGLEIVNALKPAQGRMLEDDDTSPLRPMFIAQDMVDVIPALVSNLEPTPSDNPLLGIDYASIAPILVKAIQEQQTIINDLKARITALEGAA
jgi:hypothetical protein